MKTLLIIRIGLIACVVLLQVIGGSVISNGIAGIVLIGFTVG